MIRILPSFLASALAFCSSAVAVSAERIWPMELFLQHPTEVVIGPERPINFTMNHGVEMPLDFNNKRLNYNLISLGNDWENPKKCSETVRNHGYLHTSAFELDKTGHFSVAIPFSFHLTGEFDLDRRNLVLNWPLIKIQLLELKLNQNGTSSLIPKQVTSLSIRKMTPENVKTQNDSEKQLSIHFDSILMSDALDLSAHSNYRLRVEWSADGICDEDEFRAEIGSNFRMIDIN